MHILQSKLKNSPQAIEKYKDRKVKIFCPTTFLWFMDCTAAVIPATFFKGMAKTLTVSQALEITKYYGEARRIEFHFLDDFGDDKAGIKEFDGEEIYSCVNVRFDSHKIRNNEL